MARLWSEGRESNTKNGIYGVSSGNQVIQSSFVRSGTYATEINTTNASSRDVYQFASSDTTAPFYFRFYIYIESAPSSQAKISIAYASVFSNGKVGIRLNTDLSLDLWNEEDGAQVGSSSSPLSLGTWYMIEYKVDCTTIASTAVEAKIDGTTFASGTIDLAGGISYWGIGCVDNETVHFFTDDYAINDSSGSFQNSYPGSGKIIHLKPNAAGDNSDWTNDYTYVDEVTPDDSSTLVASNTANQIADYNIEAPDVIGASDTINVVQVGVRFNLSGTTSTDPTFVVRIKASASGTVEESATISPTSTTWATNAVANPRNYPLTLYDLPGASTTAWTKADITTAQIGVREASTDADSVQVSTLWLLVDYTPATASGVSLCFWKPYANQPPSSNYATLDTRNLHPVLDFDKTTQESAIFRGVMPRSYSGGDITVYLHWAATTVTTGTGGWDVAFERIGDGQQDIDSDSFGTATVIETQVVPSTSGNVEISSVNLSNELCDSIAAGESFRLRVRRDVTNDNADNDLELLGVELRETA